MAQQSMVSPLVNVLLLLHILAFSHLMPAAAQQETAWYSPNLCSEASSARRSQCSADSDWIIGADWIVEMDCSSSDSIMVSYVDSRTHTIVDLGWESTIQIMEVHLECYPVDRGEAGGIDEEETKSCWSDEFQASKLGGPYRFNSLSAAGILPGWTCNISTCIADTNNGTFYRNKVHSCILPGATAVTASTTTASVPSTSEPTALTDDEDTTFTTVNATRAELIIRTELDFNMNREKLNIYLPVLLASLGIATLCVVLFIIMAVIISSIRIRRHLARKRALLMYNKESMVFDPHFFPSVCIDKPATFGRSPMISMVSINLLQNLDLTANIYVKEHSASYLPMDDKQTSLNFETDTDDSDAGSIKLSHPTTALDTQRSKSSDDISSTHTEIIVESSEFLEKACPRSGGACREQSGVSSEQGYVQLPHYQQGPVLSSATVTRLDCPSDDNDSVLTEVLSKGDEFKERTVAQLQAVKCSTSGYVQSSVLHTACTAEEQGMHSTSNYVESSELPMPMSEGTHSNGGYIQSSAVSAPMESKEESINLLELLLNDEMSESDDHDDSDLQGTLIPPTTATTEGYREASVYFQPANFHSAIPDHDSHCGHPKDILLNHTSTTDQWIELVDNSHSHSESHIAFHPPTTMDNEARPESDTSAMYMPSECLPGEREHSCPTPTLSSGVFTNSSAESAATTDPDSSTHAYIPSELFTRKILVPASQDSLPAAAGHGFVVHLDFENITTDH